MLKFKPGILLVAIIIFVAVTGQVALGDSSVKRPMVIILADRQAVIHSSGGTDLAKSAVGLISTLRKGAGFAFFSLDKPTEFLGPILANDPDFKTFQEEVDRALGSLGSTRTPNIVSALTEAYNLLGAERAGAGSTVYFITGGGTQKSLVQATAHMEPLATLFKESDWSITGLSLPGSSVEVTEFLERISTDTGGESFALSIPIGFRDLSNKILMDEANGSLNRLADEVMSPNDVLTAGFDIAPGTSETNLMFFKGGPWGSLRLSNPSGFEASSGDRTASTVVETPHVVIWKMIDPTPGHWKVDVRGMDGVLSGWHYAVNKYTVALESYGYIAVNEPITLVAYVTDGRDKLIINGVALEAKIASPEGAMVVHELKDDGISADSVAGDGYYSATISPVAAEGDYRVELDLLWPESGHRVVSQASFTAKVFPTISITTLQTEKLQLNNRTKIATALVHVGGQPYAVSVDELTHSLVSNAENAGTLDMQPQRLLGEGRAWAYDVFFTPVQEAVHSVNLRLDLEYAGTVSTYTSESIALSSMTSRPPPSSVVAVASVASVDAPPQLALQPAVVTSGVPRWLMAIPIILLLSLGVGAVYLLSLPKPYGYLYDDREKLIVDFARLKRNPISRLLFGNLVKGEELGVPALENVSFRFSRRQVDLNSSQAMPTVRVNNRPLIGHMAIQDRTWIGTHGRLFSFMLSPVTADMEPSLADDD